MKDGKPAKNGFKLDRALRKLRQGDPVVMEGLDLVFTRIHGRNFRFATTHARDPIQRKWRKGVFYEPKELAAIKAHFPHGGTFVDIGANVGNHSLYVAGFMAPARVIPFEPNPTAYKLLIANIMLNDFGDVFDLSHLGLGLGEEAAEGFAMLEQPRNLGGSRMADVGEGGLKVVTGDMALGDVTPDMIKVDVEGMEIKVLRGLKETIARARPILLLEIDDENDADFQEWIAPLNYRVVEKVRRYRNNTNYVLVPASDEE
ncbi:FkbM family methyltransferase [Rhodalgimonas zhirmunskyi]|uniref:FkbM family methyltransferase n=1 Tax=Rhodalgimonas zhirmunskyi TaxID=2964767 RepID=A0AAJ1U821_9RHOB|nr:FkbM family methyltransferase [Rhodoalgimonas zhirmunskyi]MDQ2093018.1 FkbM family methyltransferase [Rhodoalgimonas zhirmunskyi]